jgi:23S rRNA pseudouridine1911/1915/1917 synthase
MASLGHPVVGDALYGAPREIRGKSGPAISLSRNFLHSAELQFEHPRSGELLSFSSSVPELLTEFLRRIEPNPSTENRL